jgi:hypothetical protein
MQVFMKTFAKICKYSFGFAIIFQKIPVWFTYGDNFFWLLNLLRKLSIIVYFRKHFRGNVKTKIYDRALIRITKC